MYIYIYIYIYTNIKNKIFFYYSVNSLYNKYANIISKKFYQRRHHVISSILRELLQYYENYVSKTTYIKLYMYVYITYIRKEKYMR